MPGTPKASARQRLLAAADELFYSEGVQSVGVDRSHRARRCSKRRRCTATSGARSNSSPPTCGSGMTLPLTPTRAGDRARK